MKVSNFTKEVDPHINATKLKLSYQAQAELSTVEIPFSPVKEKLLEINAFTTMDTLRKKIDGSIVNVSVYVRTSGTEIEELPTRFGRKSKRDVFLHDDSSSHKVLFTLWGNHIPKISEDGAYVLRELRVKSYGGKQYLTSTALTTVIPSKEVFKNAADDPIVQNSKIDFPAITIDQLSEVYFCIKCNHQAIVTGRIAACNNCGGKSLLKEKFFSVKIFLRSADDSIVTLKFPHQLFVKFLEFVGLKQTTAISDIEDLLLTQNDITVDYNDRSKTIVHFSKKGQ